MALAYLGKAYGSSVIFCKVGKYAFQHIKLSFQFFVLTQINDQIIPVVELK